MKARHKDTGEIIELAEEGIISCDGRRFCWYQVELIPEPIDDFKPSLPYNIDEAAILAWAYIEEDEKLFVRNTERSVFVKGYKQAEKDLAPAFEFPFYVPDNDGFIVFTPMDNQTIRRELKLKKGERVIVSIRKEHEKE